MNVEKFVSKVISEMFVEISPERMIEKTKHIWKKYMKEEFVVISVGKSAIPMLRGIINSGVKVIGGMIATTEDWKDVVGSVDNNFEVFFGGHPFPNKESLAAGERAIEILKEEDNVLFLISGGGSSLMEVPSIPIEEYNEIVKKAMKFGLNIHELNTLRRYLSKIKGGKILRYAKGKVKSLIISDVPGNYLEDIASGLTYMEKKNFEYAEKLARNIGITLKKYSLSPPVKKEEFRKFYVKNFLVGGIFSATNTLKNIFAKYKIPVKVLGNRFGGEAKELGEFVGALTHLADKAYIFGGEWEVSLGDISGIGGPNLELILSSNLTKSEGSLIVSVGTDGIDGNSPAAGAYSFGKIDDELIIDSLEKHDSYTTLKKLGYTIETGVTGTNVADVCFLIPENIVNTCILPL